MYMNDIGNANATKMYATRGNMYTIHKYTLTNMYLEHVPNNLTTTNMREKGTDKYENALI